MPGEVDWTAIERSPEFRELTRSRTRFAMTSAIAGLAAGVAIIVLANTAQDAMARRVAGGMSLGFLCGVALVVMTWAISFAYLRKSKRVWLPLEEKVREIATAGGSGGESMPSTGRFERDRDREGVAAGDGAPATVREGVRR